MDVQAFGRRLRELRERAGLTQKELAERVGVSLSAVARWEQAMREPLASNFPPLVAALQVDYREFFEPPSAQEERGPGRPSKPTPSTRPTKKKTTRKK